jgi:hypothetical protein
MLPRIALSELQQTTQLSSLLPPPLALANRCSMLASARGSADFQKKQAPPWTNIRRSRRLVGMRYHPVCIVRNPAACGVSLALRGANISFNQY